MHGREPPAGGPQDRNGKWRDLGIRFASAAVLAPIGLACIWFGGAVWAVLVIAACIGLAAEWSALCGASLREAGWLVPAAALLVCVAALASPAAACALLAVCAIVVWRLSGRRALGAGTLYVGLPGVSLLVLRAGPDGFAAVLFVMLVVWSGDIGAYLAGRLFGGRLLAPSISPGKTWSGAAGGLLAAIAAGVAVGAGGPVHASALLAALLAGALSVVAQAGDLLESRIKRHYGRKDSGSLIPGHGGLLDRLDGVLAAAPVACAVSLIGGREGFTLWH